MNCDKCGRFHDHGPGSAWKVVYSGGPIPMPDREITRCRACVEKHGPFLPQYGIKSGHSCGLVSSGEQTSIPNNAAVSCINVNCGWEGELKDCPVEWAIETYETGLYQVALCPKCGEEFDI
jgi:hypothetical protein